MNDVAGAGAPNGNAGDDPVQGGSPASGWSEEMKAAAPAEAAAKNGLTMKKYLTDKDRAEEADALRIALAIIRKVGLELDTKLPVLPPDFAQFLIAPQAYLLIVPSTTATRADRRKVEAAMCMARCDAIIISLVPQISGPRKILFEIGIDGLTPVWHSEYVSRGVDGGLYFVPGHDPSGPLFKLTKQGLKSSADFGGIRFSGY
ncbi:hypothetical protein CDQ91_05220 [Sphingopyxis witflariensis]|uniref:Uncharacterized protein n=2 Tax=Sphingopyxis witflariensis TaxID=173675 RepID=A0A246K3L5_9SPHN|nr:hypothetical protein CDQ91_05220 [Sphingopyxis witflariensis]